MDPTLTLTHLLLIANKHADAGAFDLLTKKLESGDLEDSVTLGDGNTPMVNYRASGQSRHQQKRLGSVLARLTTLDSDEVRLVIETTTAYLLGYTLDFIPDTDPDAWVSVYADGTHISTCLTPEPGELVLYDTTSPRTIRRMPLRTRSVKAYAAGEYLTSAPEPYRFQKLALAVLRDKHKQVIGRAVVNVRDKKYVTTYGNHTLDSLLHASGFDKTNSAFKGCVLRTSKIRTVRDGERVQTDNSFWLCPYLDGLNNLRAITFGGEYFFEISDNWDVLVADYSGKVEFNGEFRDVG